MSAQAWVFHPSTILVTFGCLQVLGSVGLDDAGLFQSLCRAEGFATDVHIDQR